MRRLLLMVACSSAVAGGGAAGAAVAVAATPAELAALTPQQVVERFVVAMNARDPELAKCELLTRDRRDAFVVPAYAGLSPRLPESWSDANRLKACDAFVGIFNGYRDDTGNRWTSTEIGAAVVVEQRADAIHLRVPVVRRFDDGSALAADAAVFLVREEGAWRLAVPSLLWEFSDSDLGEPPAALAQLPPLLDALRRKVARKDAVEQRIVRDYLATRTRVARRPLRWGGATSSAPDPLRDIVSQSGERIPDQASPRNDLRGATLRSDGRTLTFELRFRDRVPRVGGISFDLQQLRWESRRRGTTLGATASWSVQLADGWASALRGDAEQPEAIAGLRATARGRTLRLALPAAAVRGRVRLGRPFRWQLETWQRPPIGLFDDAPVRAWRDLLPNRQTNRPGAGVLHRP